MKRPTSFYAASFVFASTLAGIDVMAATDTFFPDRPELRLVGAILALAGIAYLSFEIVVGE